MNKNRKGFNMKKLVALFLTMVLLLSLAVGVVAEEDVIFETDIIYPDGVIWNLSKVTLVLKYIAGWDVELNIDNFDANFNDYLDLDDVTIMLRFIAGWDIDVFLPE